MKKKSVVIISGPVGKTPEDITYPFVFAEAHRLAKRRLDIHMIRAFARAGMTHIFGLTTF